MNFKGISDKLITSLEEKGIKAYIWHVATSGSTYIRFDDPRMGSIRLSNHDGRDKLKYKFNIRSDMKGQRNMKWVKDDGKWRLYIKANAYKELIPILIKKHEDLKTSNIIPKDYYIPVYKRT